MPSKNKISRRDFIKGAAAGAAAVGVDAILGTSPAAAQTASLPTGIPDKWDYETDVVVIGYGGAGGAAAVSAKDAGADVIILEKNTEDKNYSNTRMAGGFRCWWMDDAVEGAKYFQALAFGVGLPDGLGDPAFVYPKYPKKYAEEITQTWVKTVMDVIPNWWRSLKAENVVSQIEPPAFPKWPGAKHVGTTNFTLPAEWKKKSLGGGDDLWVLYSENAKAKGIKVLWGTPGKRLIQNPGDGRIVGVIANQGGKEITIKARRGVALTCGGFEYDKDLTSAFLPGWGWSWIGTPSNTGDGVRMAMGVGAELTHMWKCAARLNAGGVIVDEIGTGFTIMTGTPGSILVDNRGRRYANEVHTNQDPERYIFYTVVTALDITTLEYPRIPSWHIYDESANKRGPVALTMYGAHRLGIYKWSADNSAEIKRGWILKADTIEELAQKIAAHPHNLGKMKSESLKNTIDKFNSNAADGKDVDFARDPKTLGPVKTGPFYAIAMYPGGPNTKGGPTRNGKCQVISIHGGPIPGLYAAGELGSVLSFSYQACTNIAECTVFGYTAGKNAAAEKPWDATA